MIPGARTSGLCYHADMKVRAELVEAGTRIRYASVEAVVLYRVPGCRVRVRVQAAPVQVTLPSGRTFLARPSRDSDIAPSTEVEVLEI